MWIGNECTHVDGLPLTFYGSSMNTHEYMMFFNFKCSIVEMKKEKGLPYILVFFFFFIPVPVIQRLEFMLTIFRDFVFADCLTLAKKVDWNLERLR